MNSRRLFISHSWNDSDSYNRLVKLLDERGYFTYQNASVPIIESITGTNRAVWEAIENKIKWCQVFLFLASISSSYSGSVKKEFEIAKKNEKPIIAIIPYGAERVSTLRLYADETVGWNTDHIVEAIRKFC